MNILDKLQGIISFDFSGLKKFQNKISLNIQLLNRNTKVTNQGPNVTVNINVLSENELQGVKEMLRSIVSDDKVPILQNYTQRLLEDFTQVDNESESQNLITYFKGKIPAIDIEVLRQSIYIKVVHDRGESIQKLKWDLTARYGNRGKNICNLYSAGYFTSQIKPMYEVLLSQADFSPNDFNIAYDRIVDESPYAVFINREMSNQGAEAEVRDRIETGRKYGIKYLNIHGIGEENVDKIVYILEKLKLDFPLPQEIKRQGNVIVVKIQF